MNRYLNHGTLLAFISVLILFYTAFMFTIGYLDEVNLDTAIFSVLGIGIPLYILGFGSAFIVVGVEQGEKEKPKKDH